MIIKCWFTPFKTRVACKRRHIGDAASVRRKTAHPMHIGQKTRTATREHACARRCWQLGSNHTNMNMLSKCRFLSSGRGGSDYELPASSGDSVTTRADSLSLMLCSALYAVHLF